MGLAWVHWADSYMSGHQATIPPSVEALFEFAKIEMSENLKKL
jgi:hypothetical protein